MCVSCGCNQPEEKHGDDRNITLSDLHAAAQAANIDMMTLASNLQHGLSGSLHSPETDQMTQDIEAMNQPLPSGLFQGRLESTPYPE